MTYQALFSVLGNLLPHIFPLCLIHMALITFSQVLLPIDFVIRDLPFSSVNLPLSFRHWSDSPTLSLNLRQCSSEFSGHLSTLHYSQIFLAYFCLILPSSNFILPLFQSQSCLLSFSHSHVFSSLPESCSVSFVLSYIFKLFLFPSFFSSF